MISSVSSSKLPIAKDLKHKFRGLLSSHTQKLIYVFLSAILFSFTSLFSPVYAQTATTTPTFQLPLTGVITTYYSSYHPAIDIANVYGTPIHPIASGTVIKAGWDNTGYGNMIVIDHGNGYQSLYAHMKAIIVSVNQKVNDSTVIGNIGLTGNTTGPHLHLGISKNGATVNPLTILPPFPKATTNGPKVVGTGGAILTSLPDTGVSVLSLLVALCLPLGFLLTKNHSTGTIKNPQWAWENRTFKK